MVWIMSHGFLLSCQGAKPGDASDSPPSQHGSPSPESGADTAETAQSGDTSEPLLWNWSHSPCDHQPRAEVVTLFGVEEFDWAGFSVDAEDMEGDGCDEVLVGAPNSGYNTLEEGAVYLLRAPQPGALDEQSYVVWEEPDADEWIERLALVPPQVAWHSDVDLDALAIAFDIPLASADEPIGLPGIAGRLTTASRSYGFLNDIEGCEGLGTPSLCVTSVHSDAEEDPYDGAVWIMDMPIVGDVDILDFRVRLHGAAGDRAEIVEADDDLDGDGLDDLVVGAFGSGAVGRIGLVSDPPAGDHVLWDVAFATIEGEVPNGDVGSGLSTGDANGDGYIDVLAGSPQVDGGRAYLMEGPFGGAHPVDDAQVTVTGSLEQAYTGLDGSIGDVDGDGQADLVVCAPDYFGDRPGLVAIFASPAAGAHAFADAEVHLASGSATPDGFGFALATGDLDGDGRMDLAIGAPQDARAAYQAGSVTLVFGASL
jgi:hypothetical protein